MTWWDRCPRRTAKNGWDTGTSNGEGRRVEILPSAYGGRWMKLIAVQQGAYLRTLPCGLWAEMRRTPNRCYRGRSIGEPCWTGRVELMFMVTMVSRAVT